MKHDANARCSGQAKRSGEPEGVEERENAHNAVVGMQEKHLTELLHVGSDIVMREDDAFGFAGRATGKNNRGGVVELCAAPRTGESLDQSSGEKCGESGGYAFAEARILRNIFDENGFAGRLDVHAIEERASSDDGLEIALPRT